MNSTDREAAKARFRAKLAARKAMPAREYLFHMLCATNTHADAEAILDRLERESPTAQRLSAVMDFCDDMERKGITSGEPFTVRRVHALALGDEKP
jgi:Fe2+ or Zn2+ uptake regulation protein